MPQIFIDCDGVLADFDSYFKATFGSEPREFERIHGSEMFWETIRQHGDFFLKLPLMPDAMELMYAVRDLNPIILTGCSQPWGRHQKRNWADKHFPGVPMIACRSEYKYLHMDAGDILIDDWTKYRHLWEEAGGAFIHHLDAKNSIAALRGMGILPPHNYPNPALELAEPLKPWVKPEITSKRKTWPKEKVQYSLGLLLLAVLVFLMLATYLNRPQ